MTQTTAKDSPERPPERPERQRRPGRLRAAVQVLSGESLVPDQIRWEWIEYQQRFNDLLDRYSASLARSAKAEKKRIASLHESLQPTEPSSEPQRVVPSRGHKADLYRRASLLLRGGGPLGETPNGVQPPPEESP